MQSSLQLSLKDFLVLGIGEYERLAKVEIERLQGEVEIARNREAQGKIELNSAKGRYLPSTFVSYFLIIIEMIATMTEQLKRAKEEKDAMKQRQDEQEKITKIDLRHSKEANAKLKVLTIVCNIAKIALGINAVMTKKGRRVAGKFSFGISFLRNFVLVLEHLHNWYIFFFPILTPSFLFFLSSFRFVFLCFVSFRYAGGTRNKRRDEEEGRAKG